MNNNIALFRAVRGPLVLIVVGTLFAFDHFGGWPFQRTWPVLFILIGVWKLLEYVVARPPISPGPPYPGPQSAR